VGVLVNAVDVAHIIKQSRPLFFNYSLLISKYFV